MINRYVLAILLSCLFTSLTFAQVQRFQADDGTQIELEVVSINPDKGRNAAVYVGAFGVEGLYTFGFSYYKPGSFFVNALAAKSGAMVDGSLFLISKVKQKNMRQSVKSVGYTRYVVTIPGEKKKSFGLHAGASYVDNSKRLEGPPTMHTASGIFGGLTLLGARHTHWKIHDVYREAQGTLVNRLNADFVYYISTDFPDEIPEEERVDLRKIGFRIYYDGKATLWSRKGRISLHYMLGYGQNSYKEAIPLIAGLGLGYNW